MAGQESPLAGQARGRAADTADTLAAAIRAGSIPLARALAAEVDERLHRLDPAEPRRPAALLAEWVAIMQAITDPAAQAAADRLCAATRRLSYMHRRSLMPATSGPERGLHYCVGCTTGVDHHTLYAVWPCLTWRVLTRDLEAADG